MTRVRSILRECTAAGLCFALFQPAGWSQELSMAPVRPSAPVVVRPYMAATVPPVRLSNSTRLNDLVRGGNLYLTAQDAIALALENNIDIEVSRYGPILAEWQLERAQAGGALPGVPSGASQAGSVAVGQGVAGSQAAAGVSVTGANVNAARNNATISQIGPVTQTLDPIFQQATTFSHTSLPQPNLVQSLTPVLFSNTHVYTGSLQQGFLSGGGASVNYNEHYLSENAPSDLLNPSVAPSAAIGAQHNLLRGFGIAVNARTITVARMNINTSDLNFRTAVIGVVSQVLRLYYALAASYEDVKAKRSAAEVAHQFSEDIREEIRIGAVAPTAEIDAQTQVVNSDAALADSQATLDQQELTLKSMLSRTGTADPVLARAHIIPVDTIQIPANDDLPPIDKMVEQALTYRSDLAAEQAGIRASEVSALGTHNGVLPTLQVFGQQSQAGLSGTPKTVAFGDTLETADPYFAGGIGNALGQVFRRNFPTERIGAFYAESIRNRAAQADYAIDELQLRQQQLRVRRDFSQVQVDILNYVIAVRQARARYESAAKNRVLQEQLLSAEQKKFALGASTPYNVVQQQRDLTAAQSSELTALVSYESARIALDQTLGTVLEKNNVSIEMAREGRVPRKSEPVNVR